METIRTTETTDRQIHVHKTTSPNTTTTRTLGGLAGGALQQGAELRRPLGGAGAEAVKGCLFVLFGGCTVGRSVECSDRGRHTCRVL